MPGGNWLTGWARMNHKHHHPSQEVPVASNKRPLQNDHGAVPSLAPASLPSSTGSSLMSRGSGGTFGSRRGTSASTRHQQQQQPPQEAEGRVRSFSDSGGPIPTHESQQGQLLVTTSLSPSQRFVADLFGSASLLDPNSSSSPAPQQSTSQSTQPPSSPPPPRRIVNTGKYLNEMAFLQQYDEQRLRRSSSYKQQQQPPKTALEQQQHRQTSRAFAPLRTHSDSQTLQKQRLARMEQTERRPNTTANRTNPTPNQTKSLILPFGLFSGAAESQQQQQQDDASSCVRCEELEHQLTAAWQDVEYLRSIIHQHETAAGTAAPATAPTTRQHDSTTTSQSPRSNTRRSNQKQSVPIMTLSEASRQLLEANARHNKQVEELAKERTRWQHNVMLKLQKYVHLYQDLLEESEIRNQKLESLQQEHEAVLAERDDLSKDNVLLRAQLATLQEASVEQPPTLRDNDDKAILQQQQERDQTIADLTAQLKLALDQLEQERR